MAAEEAEAALASPGTRPFDLTGRPMQGWLLWTPTGTPRTTACARWLDRGLAYASSLPPK